MKQLWSWYRVGFRKKKGTIFGEISHALSHAANMKTWGRIQPAAVAISSTEHAGGTRFQEIFKGIAHALSHATKNENGFANG
ncbi:MAG TPA: hypothetical protein VNM72_07640 [Blastocatellia bacterium]|nr:hypothetical protein [Blastocatellia bacterium]